MPDKPILFGPKAAQRTKEVVKRVEAQPYPDQTPQKWRPVISGSGPRYVEGIVNGSGITPFNTNTNTYGHGSVVIYIHVFNSNTNGYNSIVDPAFVTTNGLITVINFSANSGLVANGTRVGLVERQTINANLQFELIWRDC